MASVAERSVEVQPKTGFGWVVAPYLLAMYFFATAFWGMGRTGIVDTDAARHAMNGAFLYDLVRTGQLSQPVAYAEDYYGHLPALSMPYHPPLFPAIEGLFYAIFGVKLFTARLVVALAVGITVVLLYRFLAEALNNRILALCIAITICSLWTSQRVARDVMLEYPAMAFMLGAVYCLRNWERDFTMRRAIMFALFASAAFWTKQHAVIIGGIPPLYAVISGRWRLLLRRPALVALALFSLSVGAYILLVHRFNNVGVHAAATSTEDLHWIATRTLPFYFSSIGQDLIGLPMVFAVCALIARLVSRVGATPSLALFWAWVVSMAVVLVDLSHTDDRYLFFVYPALFAIGYQWLFRGCERFWGARGATMVAIGFTAVWFIAGFFVKVEFLRGPGEAAASVVSGQPSRIVYAGEADGNFIYSVRELDSHLATTVIPGGKMPPNTFEPGALEEFCRQYGISWVVLEKGTKPHPWSGFTPKNPGELKLEHSFPLESNRDRWQTGVVEVYRFEGSSAAPGGTLKLPVRKLGRSIDVKL